MAELTFRQGRALMRKRRHELAGAIEEDRDLEEIIGSASRRAGRPRKRSDLWEAAKHLSTTELSLVLLATAVLPRKEPLARYSAAQELGHVVVTADDTAAALANLSTQKPPRRHFTAIGMQAAELLHRANLIDDLKPPKGKHRDMSPFTLSAEARRSVEHLMDAAPATIIREPPAARLIVKPAWRSATTVLPPGPLVQQATDLVRATKWRVNQRMLAVLNALYPTTRSRLRGIPKLELIERQALHQANTTSGTFYFDGHYDWRGRYYSEHLYGLDWTAGSDVVRSLLEFADGFPCDEWGKAYLELHLTSMWGQGVDKLSDAKRQQWVWDRELAIRTVGDALKCKAFWLKAKEPFRFLAACQAYAAMAKGEPVHLPISFDVTCSGVGIYALLTRDARLATLVGILPSPTEKPQDFYSHFGDICIPKRARSKAKDYVKTAMYGAKVAPRRKDGTPRWAETSTDRAFWQAFGEEPTRLFFWLREQAASQEVLRWTLPDAFEVAHDYREVIQQRDVVNVGFRRIELKQGVIGPGRDRDKAVAAICANFVQSYDGAVLRSVVRHGAAIGIPAWGAAHDCFSVHPAFAHALHTSPSGSLGALQLAYQEVFGPDRLAELKGYPVKFGPLTWDFGAIVG